MARDMRKKEAEKSEVQKLLRLLGETDYEIDNMDPPKPDIYLKL